MKFFFFWFHRKFFGCIFECGKMVDSLGYWYGVILVCYGTIHSGASFVIFTLLVYHRAMLLV